MNICDMTIYNPHRYSDFLGKDSWSRSCVFSKKPNLLLRDGNRFEEIGTQSFTIITGKLLLNNPR